MNYNSIFKGLVLACFIMSVISTTSSPVMAECSIVETPTGYSMICSGTILGEISGTDQEDIIHILPQATLLYYLPDSGDSVSEAMIIGIYGLQGNDEITNDGDIQELQARAETTAVGVSVTIDGTLEGDASGAALSDSSAKADASATGIDGGADNDTIDNQAEISAEAQAVVDATGVATDITVTLDGNASGASLSDASVTATSTAIGIEGGEGDDTIDNEGDMDILAISDAVAVAVDVTIDGTMEGNVAGEALSDASATADAMAIGIEGGLGIDEITNRGAIVGNVDSSATAVGVAVGIAITEEGNASGAALSDASVTADAAVGGIDGGGDADAIDNRGDIVLLSNSDATGVVVSLTVAGSMKGDAEGLSVSDASVTANATATGISGGEGDDTIINDSSMTAAYVDADATAVSVGLTVSGSMEGNADGAALSDGSATADAMAIGIDGGMGQDTIDNWSLINEDVNASATTVGVGLNIAITKEGNASGAALSDASVTANAAASGIDGGGDTDVIDNRGDIALLANSDATGVAVSLDVAGTMKGDAEGSSVSDASVTAISTATGIVGGEGDDTIDNEGVITLMNGSDDDETDASATAVSVVLTVSGTMEGNVTGEALSDSSATADAMAIGIGGGLGIDEITNRGAIVGIVDSSATAVGVGLDVNLIIAKDEDVEGSVSGAALSDARVTADAGATGIDGGGDTDIIDNRGDIALLTNSDAVGVAASLDVAGSVALKGGVEGEIEGKALSNTSTEAYAETTGIDGGDDSDRIINSGDINLLQANSSSTGVSASLNVSAGVAANGDAKVNVTGEAVSDATVMADATTSAIRGGSGEDEVINTGDFVNVKSDSEAVSVAASLTITGALAFKGDADASTSGSAVSAASANALSTTVAIDGGEGNDIISNTGNIINLESDSTATSVSAGANVSAVVTIKGNADADITGEAVGDSRVISQAIALGLDGGLGDDEIDNEGDISLLSTADATGVAAELNVSAALSFKGVSTADVSGSAVSNSSVFAKAEATGIDGGMGQDTILNSGNITLMNGDEDIFDADALAVSASLNVSGNVAIKGVAAGSVEGAAASNATVTAEAAATGIDGGGDNDIIDNTGVIKLLPSSNAEGIAASLNISGNMVGESAGSAISDSSVIATSMATGIDGGEGADIITNEGAITLMKQEDGEDEFDANALGVSASLDVSGNLNGTTEGQAVSKTTTTADATAIGIDGGSGTDEITNTAVIVADVDSKALGVAASLGISIGFNGSVEGAALSDASVTAEAAATGIDGGEGADTIVNERKEGTEDGGDIGLFATSDAESVAVSVELAGAMRGTAEGKAVADSSAEANSTATGLDGGSGEDDIYNEANIFALVDSHATATGVAAGLTVAVNGMASGAAISDVSAESFASATGIDGADDNDTIDNKGALNLYSFSNSETTAVSVQLTGTMGGVAEGKAASDGSASAISESTGIDGGQGDDVISSSINTITTFSNAITDTTSVSVAGGGFIGLAENASIANASSSSEASSTAIDGGQGDDTIENSSEIESTAKADAEATATSVAVTVGIGSASTTGTADSSATARANATGIEGGSENDEITNTAAITVGGFEKLGPMATAQAGATEVTVGLAVGANLSESSSNAAAIAEVNAAGISGGSGDDVIDNTGDITVKPDSEGTGGMANASAESTTVDISITVGASLGKSSSDTSSTAVVNLAGISGGSGNDTVDNSGTIITGADPDQPGTTEAMATATAGSETFSVGLTVGGSFKDASSNASATAHSKATGIETGLGDDSVNNTGVINTFSSAAALGSAKAEKVSMTIGAMEGAVTSDASSLSTALATGIDSGEDADIIDTGSDFVVKARSVSITTSNAEDLNILSIGSAIQSATANSSSTAEALARGIDGGTGADIITVAGNYDVSADTLVFSTSRSSTIAGVSIGENEQKAQALAETTSQALAIGIDGGEGNDKIISTATLTVNTYSNAETTGTSSSNTGFNIAGSSSAESAAGATSDVTASGIGIRGGISVLDADETDADVIINEGTISVTTTVSATTNSTSTADSITFIGKAEGSAVSDASATVVADGIGIDGGADNDAITNKNTITVKTEANGSVTSTSNADSYTTFGEASSMGVSDASANVLAEATGISGGTGDDIINSLALIEIEARSVGSVQSTSNVDASVTFGDASSVGVSDASADVAAEATGISGGTGDDIINSHALVDVVVESSGDITAASNVNADVTFGGDVSSAALSDASATKKGSATGIDGGDGGDVITNYDTLNVNAISAGTVRSDSTASANSSFWGDASSITTSGAALEGTVDTKGIIGGSGGDTITNLGRVDSMAAATLYVVNSSVATASCDFVGDSEARAYSESTLQGTASSLGVSGDDGDDVIKNDGVVNVRAIANARVDSSTVAIAESFWGSAYTEAASSNFAAGESTADGVTAGAGNDGILNSELITVEAGGEVRIVSEVYSSDGPASSDARTIALAQASGIDSGADDDTITNRATVFVKSAPRVVSATRTFGNGGHVDGKVGVLLEAGATGITGGEGSDIISNWGNVLVFIGDPETESTVSEDVTSGATTFTDDTLMGEDLEAAIVGKWIRIAGGENPDFFTQVVAFEQLSGQLTLQDALTYDLSSGTTYTLYDYGDKTPDIETVTVTVGGRTRVDASTTALAQAKGIVGGDGDDEIVNWGTTTVSANNLIKAVTLTLGRNIVVDTGIESAVNAVGIEGNDQSCVTDVSDGGTTLFTDLSLKGEEPEAIVGKSVLFKSGASVDFVTFVEAFDPDTGAFTLADPLPAGGLSRGDIYTIGGGSDIITNLGTIDVGAKSAIDASSWSLDFGAADIEGQGQTLAASAGMRSGQFDDSLQNYGNISTRSAADVSSSDRVYVVFGRADQALSFEASSHSVGVEMGAGDDDFTNAENSSVYTEAVSTSRVDGVTAVIFAKITNSVDAIADSTAIGLDLGQGNNVAYNMGDIETLSQATVVANAVSVYELGETDADADAIAFASVSGVRAGSNEDQVYNDALMQVDALTDATSFAQGSQVGNRDMISEVTGGSEGDSNLRTFVDASLIPPPGQQVEILGEWVRFITGENADENFFAQVVDFVYEDIVDPDTGDIIIPAGTVVLSRDIPHPVYAEVVDPDTGDIIIEADEYTFSAARNGTSASVATSDATGIDLRDSKSIVDNAGTLDVTAFAKATTTANTYGGAATANAEATAEARGIITGDDDDVVTNTGEIDVTAEVTTESSTGETGERALAIGIETGAGDDTIVNSGSIVTGIIVNGTGPVAGVGILAGAGNDTIDLRDAARVIGSIELGEGNDVITFADTAMVDGTIRGGSDIDTIRIKDRGTFTVDPLEELECLEVNQGVLEIQGDYVLAAGDLVQAEIYATGNGQLSIINTGTLDGQLRVTTQPRAYMNGDTFDVTVADTFVGEYALHDLPSSRLLSFDINYLQDPNELDRAQVVVDVTPFTAVAKNSIQRHIAEYLDQITPSATGDLEEVIGTIQLLDESEFGAAFASLSPGMYDSSTRTTYDVTQHYTTTLLKRIHSVQQLAKATGSAVPQINVVSGEEERLLAYNGSAASIGQLYAPAQQKQPAYGIWLDGFGQWGDQDEDDGFTGYDYDVHGMTLGFDHMFRDRYIAGISIGYSGTDIDIDRDSGKGDIDAVYGSLYGSYYTKRGYIDAVLSYGDQDYDNIRRVIIGSIEREARSKHDGDLYSAFVEGGYNIDSNAWVLQPFASLHYLNLDEERFAEEGADSANLIIDDRETESLVSELGLRIANVLELNSGTLIPEMSMAWNYDFDIDDRTITTAFAGAPNNSFSIEGQHIEKNGVKVGAGITLMTKGGLSTSVKYNGEFRQDYQAHGIIGELRYEF